jgi:hypothetical protein
VFKGALIKRTSNVTIASSVLTTLAWQSTVYDTDGFVNLGAQPARLTVPAGKGITQAQALCGAQWAPSSAGDRWVQILKNGIEVDGMPGYLGPTDGSSRSRIALASAPVLVTDGDDFECQVWQSASGSLDLEADPKTWFAIVATEFAAFRGALVQLTADEAVAASTDAAIPWDAIVYDTDAFWSAGNPTRLTVPAGVSKVRLKGNIDWTFGAQATATSGCTRTALCSSAPPGRATRAMPACRASAAAWSTSHLATTSSSSPARPSAPPRTSRPMTSPGFQLRWSSRR